MQVVMERLGLTVNEAKTRVCHVPAHSFDFLGYAIGECYSTRTGRAYIGTRPSQQRIVRLRRAIHESTSRQWLWIEPDEQVKRLNRMLRGWANYFCLGPVSKAYRGADAYTRFRLRHWLRCKHRLQNRGTSRFPIEYLYQTLGLVELAPRTKALPWANA